MVRPKTTDYTSLNVASAIHLSTDTNPYILRGVTLTSYKWIAMDMLGLDRRVPIAITIAAPLHKEPLQYHVGVGHKYILLDRAAA